MKRFLSIVGAFLFALVPTIVQAADLCGVDTSSAVRKCRAAPRSGAAPVVPYSDIQAPSTRMVPGSYFPGEQAVSYIRRCITGSLSFSNIDWRESLSAFRDCYSQEGWGDLEQTFLASSLIDGTVSNLGRVEMLTNGESSFVRDENDVQTLWLDTPVTFTQWTGDLSGTEERRVVSTRQFVVRVELTPTGVEGRDSVVINHFIARGQ